jgi:hypothetical protein
VLWRAIRLTAAFVDDHNCRWDGSAGGRERRHRLQERVAFVIERQSGVGEGVVNGSVCRLPVGASPPSARRRFQMVSTDRDPDRTGSGAAERWPASARTL